MIPLLLACVAASPTVESTDSSTPAAEPVPLAGAYAVTIAQEWSGDCQFADPATYLGPEEEWTFDPRDDVLILYKDYWTVVSCSLAGLDFDCDDGSWSANRMQITRRIEGTFQSEGTVAGRLVVELDCGGSGCDTLVALYGWRMDFPCSAEAAFEGAMP